MEITVTPEQVVKELDKLEQEFVKLFLERVRLKTPVETGVLRNAWTGEVAVGAYLFENEKEYAAHIEYGTEHIAPVGMVTSTINETEMLLQQAKDRTDLK